MCGRYVSPDQAVIERAWHIGRHNVGDPFEQRFNTLPTEAVPVLRMDGDDLELTRMRWGLIPHWWKEAKPPKLTINARSEEAAGKPMWREPYRRGRCIMPAVGWFEWVEVERVDPRSGEIHKAKQPYYLYPPTGEVVGFAALMSHWKPDPASEPVTSCALLTRAAVGAVAKVHDRMPVVLGATAQKAWLDPAATDAAQVAQIITDGARQDFAYHPVRSLVSDRRNQGSDLILPVPG